MSKKIDLYTFIHKAQRVHLFTLAIKIGCADLSDETEMRSIELELRDLIARLKAHSIHEDTLIHPLFRELGDQIAVIDEEHDNLGLELRKLEDILDHKQWNLLYPELNRFISSYLAHQDEEETMQEQILWKHFDNARLGTVMTAFQASRSPAQKMDDLKFLIPGLNVAELTAIFQGIKAAAPAPAFEAACQIAQMHLEPSKWAALQRAIGQ
jgi:Hemerythrin HHE cation binding domain